MPTADRLSDVARPDAALVVISPLLVLGSRGLGGFTSLLVGSVAVALVHHAPCPVLIARANGCE